VTGKKKKAGPRRDRSGRSLQGERARSSTGVVKDITDYRAFVDFIGGRRRPFLQRHRHRWRRIKPSSGGPAYRPDLKGPGSHSASTPRPSALYRSGFLKQARGADSRGGASRLKYPGQTPASRGPSTKHHRLRAVRPELRGPASRVSSMSGDELDKKKRASRQARRDQPGGRGNGARCSTPQEAAASGLGSQGRPLADTRGAAGFVAPSSRPARRARGRWSRTSPSSGLFSAFARRVDGIGPSASDIELGQSRGEEAIAAYSKGDIGSVKVLGRRCRGRSASGPRHLIKQLATEPHEKSTAADA